MSLVLCLVTCPSSEVARTLAQTLVEEQLAACVNIIPSMKSVYRWKGEIQVEDEAQLIIKSSDHLIEALRDRVLKLHPYEVPEFVVVAPTEVSEGYGRWLKESVQQKS